MSQCTTKHWTEKRLEGNVPKTLMVVLLEQERSQTILISLQSPTYVPSKLSTNEHYFNNKKGQTFFKSRYENFYNKVIKKREESTEGSSNKKPGMWIIRTTDIRRGLEG